MKVSNYILASILLLSSCQNKEEPVAKQNNIFPVVTESGRVITITDDKSCAFFETETIDTGTLSANITIPAKVSATVERSDEGASQNIVFFENPDLSSNYAQLLQHLDNIEQIQKVNIKQKKIQLERTKDLYEHGAATGQDLLDAQTALSAEQTNLNNERSAIIEHETKLKANGYQPDVLRKVPAGTVYIICGIAENKIDNFKIGDNCNINFSSFPNEKYNGKIDGIAEMVDQTSRMIKMRIRLNNINGKIKAGMYASVSFDEHKSNNISISKYAVVTVQAQTYVFVKTSKNTFERRAVELGDEIGNKLIVFSGISNGDQVVTKGVMQLKGLSFGY